MKIFNLTLAVIFTASLSFSSVTLAHNRDSDSFKHHASQVSQYQQKKHYGRSITRHHAHHQSHSSSPTYFRRSQWVQPSIYNKYYRQVHGHHFRAVTANHHTSKHKVQQRGYRTVQSNGYQLGRSPSMNIYLKF